MDVLKVIFYLAVIVLVYWGAHKSAKVISGYSMRFQNSKYMKLMDRLPLNKDAALHIIQIGEKYMLLSVTSGKAEFLRELSADDLVELKSEVCIQDNRYDILKESLFRTASKLIKGSKQLKKPAEYFKGMRTGREEKNTFFTFSDFLNENSEIKKQNKANTTTTSVVDELLNNSIKRTKQLKHKITVDEGESEYENET